MKIKLSTILVILTILQFIYVIGLAKGYFLSRYNLSVEHEDLVFILYLMTCFIVMAIERVTIINEVNIWNQNKN